MDGVRDKSRHDLQFHPDFRVTFPYALCTVIKIKHKNYGQLEKFVGK